MAVASPSGSPAKVSRAVLISSSTASTSGTLVPWFSAATSVSVAACSRGCTGSGTPESSSATILALAAVAASLERCSAALAASVSCCSAPSVFTRAPSGNAAWVARWMVALAFSAWTKPSRWPSTMDFVSAVALPWLLWPPALRPPAS